VKVTSPAFENNQKIPEKYTCDGENVSPPLKIQDLPKETQSLAVIVDDPDAASGSWTHWIVWNIPPTSEIPENTVPGVEGNNDFDLPIYGGPCPASGEHRYLFRVFALNGQLSLDKKTSKQQLEHAIQDKIIDSAVLVGKYRRAHPEEIPR
jgi:Raf kinase inhibitor-like YbhB/YbcL family protein